LADSSKIALIKAKNVLSPDTRLYQIDLMSAAWENHWDAVFLLDVIEHCPDDLKIIQQAAQSLKSGGRLYVTTPALDCFWSYNDVYSNHLRRYNIKKYQALAASSRLILREAKYFMFFLSPLYWLSRKLKPAGLNQDQILKTVANEHKIPVPFLNAILTWIFCAESPIGLYLPFPWGTSILGVFEKPEAGNSKITGRT
jgi:SAM-dependent methyltransferase